MLSVLAAARWEWLCQSVPSEPYRHWDTTPRTDDLEASQEKPEAYHYIFHHAEVNQIKPLSGSGFWIMNLL